MRRAAKSQVAKVLAKVSETDPAIRFSTQPPVYPAATANPQQCRLWPPARLQGQAQCRMLGRPDARRATWASAIGDCAGLMQIGEIFSQSRPVESRMVHANDSVFCRPADES